MNKAIFLDRDGVLIENVDTYVRAWSDVKLLPGALSALARLSRTEHKIVIVTNQSPVGRGIISLETAQDINRRLVDTVTAAGGRIDGVFLCPHAPQDHCGCRKPLPGLLFQAAAALSIDLSRSVLVGDALTDIQAGQRAGIPTNVLVLTGRGSWQASLPEAQTLMPFFMVPRLENVVDSLLAGLLS